LREKEYVGAARALDAGPWRIMFIDSLPNIALLITTVAFISAGVFGSGRRALLGSEGRFEGSRVPIEQWLPLVGGALSGEAGKTGFPTGGIAGGDAAIQLIGQHQEGGATGSGSENEAKGFPSPGVGEQVRLVEFEHGAVELWRLILTEDKGKGGPYLPLIGDDVGREPSFEVFPIG
jgi:hypothetical protein